MFAEVVMITIAVAETPALAPTHDKVIVRLPVSPSLRKSSHYQRPPDHEGNCLCGESGREE